MEQIPLVLVAFGTTRIKRPYDRLLEEISRIFPGHPVYLALSSRRVRERPGEKWPGPAELLTTLHAQGCHWAVVQSLHLLAGHEFYRLVQEVQSCPLRTSMGLPLFWSPADYLAFAAACKSRLADLRADEAAVLVGHGTDHASWSTYLALQKILLPQFGSRVLVGVLEGYPAEADLIPVLRRQKTARIRLIPLMLVAGVHVCQDLAGGEDSWQASLEAAGFQVEVEMTGLLSWPEVIDLFAKHLADALDAISLDTPLAGRTGQRRSCPKPRERQNPSGGEPGSP